MDRVLGFHWANEPSRPFDRSIFPSAEIASDLPSCCNGAWSSLYAILHRVARRKRRKKGNEEEKKREEEKRRSRERHEKKSGRKVGPVSLKHGDHLVFPAVVFISRTGETFRSVVRAIPGADFLRGS